MKATVNEKAKGNKMFYIRPWGNGAKLPVVIKWEVKDEYGSTIAYSATDKNGYEVAGPAELFTFD